MSNLYILITQNQKQTGPCVLMNQIQPNVSISEPRITGEFQVFLYFWMTKGVCFQSEGKDSLFKIYMVCDK